MAKRITWSIKAQEDRREILNYWKKRNKSNDYSKKLNLLFKEVVKLIADYPYIGKPTDENYIRMKIVNEYIFFYELDEEDQLVIIAIWDSRQNPNKLKGLIKD